MGARGRIGKIRKATGEMYYLKLRDADENEAAFYSGFEEVQPGWKYENINGNFLMTEKFKYAEAFETLDAAERFWAKYDTHERFVIMERVG